MPSLSKDHSGKLNAFVLQGSLGEAQCLRSLRITRGNSMPSFSKDHSGKLNAFVL
ncbi:hypothetical protein LEP1GSC175_0895 [Leptospira santarosai str. HAI821]|nr:hypothetical protein LEP1GSC175_0895 [Leptospira santarosai str. HAI821]